MKLIRDIKGNKTTMPPTEDKVNLDARLRSSFFNVNRRKTLT